MMRKIIFLDIDGVLNTCWWDRKTPVDKYGYAFDPNAVANLAKIISEQRTGLRSYELLDVTLI